MNATNQKTSDSSWLRTFTIGFSIISFGITIAIIGYIVLTTKQNQPTNQQPNITSPTATQSPSASPTSDETASWKTYTDSVYGYSIKYPEHWKINPEINSFETSNFKPGEGPSPERGAHVQFTISNKSYKSINDWLPSESTGDQFIANQTTFVINNLPAASYDNNGIGASKIVGIFNERDEKVYQFNFSSSSSSRQENLYIFDQILSTFQFAD